jgi:uncharacterized integral membrane protein
MQLMLILGIAFAIGAVIFALQNNGLVVVTLALWSFEGSLAIVLLLALGLGVLITALLTTPTMLRAQWTTQRLRRQIASLEREVAQLSQDAANRNSGQPGQAPAGAPQDKPYVGLRSLLANGETSAPDDARH